MKITTVLFWIVVGIAFINQPKEAIAATKVIYNLIVGGSAWGIAKLLAL